MTIGEKIKRIRIFRNMTQKELGERIGLEGNAANRLAQYEIGYRVPKRELLEKITDALDISPGCLLGGDEGTLGDVMGMLLWMDETNPGLLQFTTIQFDDPNMLFDDDRELLDPQQVTLHGNASAPANLEPPTVLWTESGMLDDFFREWGHRQRELYAGRITQDEYFEWKILWPLSSDFGGKRQPQRQWRKKK